MCPGDDLVEMGRIEGSIALGATPKYMQEGGGGGNVLYPENQYLLCKIMSVDNVVTPDQRPMDAIDTFVEVQFDGVSKNTMVCEDTAQPLRK